MIFGSACILDGVLNFSEKISMVKVVKNQKKEESDEIKVQECKSKKYSEKSKNKSEDEKNERI